VNATDDLRGPRVPHTVPPGSAGRMTGSGTGTARVGLLERRPGFAATRSRVESPAAPQPITGETVETWVVGGRKVTNRAGAGEYLGLAPATVNQYFSPSGRRTHSTPEPLPEHVNGQQVFALDDLDAFQEARRPAGRAAPKVDDPDELIDIVEFARIKNVKRDTMKRYIEDSLDAWARGEDGYLLRPDKSTPVPRMLAEAVIRGHTHQWRRGRAVAWSFPQRKGTGGRKPGPRPQISDLREVLAGTSPDERPTVRELAAILSERLDTDVSSQVVRRLLRRDREEAESANP
jgi:hypothetical protein